MVPCFSFVLSFLDHTQHTLDSVTQTLFILSHQYNSFPFSLHHQHKLFVSTLLLPHTHTQKKWYHTDKYIVSIQCHFYMANFYVSLLQKYAKSMELLGSSTSNPTLWFHGFLVSCMSFGWMVRYVGKLTYEWTVIPLSPPI